jgi:hypothetical protein
MKTEKGKINNENEVRPPVNAPSAQFNETKALLLELAAETEELKRAAGGSIIELLADWVAQQYLLATRQELANQPAGPERVKLLRQAVDDVAALQRGGRWAAKLKLDREKLAWEQQKHQEALAAQKEPRQRPDYLRPLTDEERNAILDKADEIMGLK